MEMNILISIDDNYLEQAITMLNSLFMNNKNSKFSIYMLYNKCSDKNIIKLKKFIESKNNMFIPQSVDDKIFEFAPKRSHTTIETYFRILAYGIFTQVNKILYLDPDIIITGDIRELYNTEMSKHAIAGVPDFGINNLYSAHKRMFGIYGNYINGGVLLMNFEMMRKLSTLEEVIKSFAKNVHRLPLQDQDFLNFYYKEYILCVEAKYNTDVWYRNCFDIMIEATKHLFRRNVPIVIHFMGAEYKPWRENGYGGKYIREYMKYSYIKECKSLHHAVYINYTQWWYTYFRLIIRYLKGEELSK